MQRRFLHRACQFVLIFFLAASLSPKYASLLENSDSGSLFGGGEAEEKTLVHGIFWLNLVGSELLDSVHQDAAAPQQAIGAEADDEDFLLIKRKRAVNRERFVVAPLIATEELPAIPDDFRHPFFSEYSIAHDPIRCHADGYTSLATGLSPPALIA
ncbi:MAG: hypothetical protein ACYC7L_06975 [Nitrospirota bacterium]